MVYVFSPLWSQRLNGAAQRQHCMRWEIQWALLMCQDQPRVRYNCRKISAPDYTAESKYLSQQIEQLAF